MEDDIDQSHEHCAGGLMMFAYFKDGSSDNNSSAILNKDNVPHSAISCEILHPNEQPVPSILRFDCASSSHSSINYLQFSDHPRIASNTQKAYHQMMKMEENNLLTGGDEHCNSFEEEQSPSLSWYCPEPRI
ncbi:uncharacterized protein LOC131232427 [Magnolia sinica]|uniref:uncharacterized protein LOC131232427 n=1 Tax=Magnolia sinica TaxID=86752 RepID=UPI002658A146|nr:uncharacterized protein LOC131232427 [Magnolia sinica]